MQPIEAPGRRRLAALGCLVLLSGCAGLGYQIVWTQQSAVWLGHEAAAVLAVVTAFFGGLALGALTLGRRIERSARPERWVAGCEGVIAAWSLVLALGMAPVGAGLLALTGAEPGAAWQWVVAFSGTLVVLLPATVAMGATLPAMERVLGRLGSGPAAVGAPIAWLYAGNTLGAVVGVLGAALWLVPAVGLARTAAVCALLNTVCAVIALTLGKHAPTVRASSPLPNAPALPAAPSHPAGPAASAASTAPPARRRLVLLLAATGLLGIGYEVLVVRVISQLTENTVYTFALVLAVYLVGTALGAALYSRRAAPGRAAAPADSARTSAVLGDRLLALLAAACLLGTGGLWAGEQLHGAVQQHLRGGMAAALTAEAALAIIAFGLPTVAMGALFSHLATQAAAAGIGFGRALGINTLGAAAAPGLVGVGLVPALGHGPALLLVAVGYLALASRRAWSAPGAWATAVAAIALTVWAPPLVFVDVPPGGRLLSYREGTMGAVSVIEDGAGVARLYIDNRQQEGSSSSRLADARQALLPLLLHPAPERALFLGLGTGVTASAAAEDPGLQVDAVELLPEVIAASAHFTGSGAGADAAVGAPNPRLRIVAADARRFVRATERSYDVIVSDNFHPARSGSGALYTVEHFRAVRARLEPGGVFCQWLPLHQLDLASLRSIVRTFLAVSPEATAVLATYSLQTPVLGLVARVPDATAAASGTGGGRIALQQLRERLDRDALPRRLPEHGLHDDIALLGSMVAGPTALARFAGSAPLNTDDRPVVAYGAPRITYAPDSSPAERLSSLLHALRRTDPAEVVDAGTGAAADAWRLRLAAYWSARDRFIDAGRSVRASDDAATMLAQVRAPLLAVLRTSPDFRPAYDPLLRMALVLGRTDPAAARALLAELAALQPARPEAAQALLALR